MEALAPLPRIETTPLSIAEPEEEWMASNAGERIEAKLDRVFNTLNELHRELGAVLARDATQEKAMDQLIATTTQGRRAVNEEIDKLETRHVELQREFDRTVGGLRAHVKIMWAISGGIGVAVLGILGKLVADFVGG